MPERRIQIVKKKNSPGSCRSRLSPTTLAKDPPRPTSLTERETLFFQPLAGLLALPQQKVTGRIEVAWRNKSEKLVIANLDQLESKRFL